MGYALFWSTSYLPCVGLIPSVEFISLRLPSLSEFVLSKCFRSKWSCRIIAWNRALCAKVQVNTDVWCTLVKKHISWTFCKQFYNHQKLNDLNWWVDKLRDRTSQVSNKCTTLKNLFAVAEGKVKKIR